MKKLLFILILFFAPKLASASISHVQTPAGGTDCGTVTTCNLAFGSNVTAGNMIATTCAYGSTLRTITLSDTLTNTYTSSALAVTNVSDATYVVGGYSLNIAGGADTVTCAISGGGAVMRLMASEFSGVATSGAFDATATASGTGTGAAPVTSTSTPSNDGALLYSFMRNSAAASIAAGTDFTLATRVPNSTSARVGSEYYIQPTAAAHVGSFTPSQNNWAIGLMVFYPPTSSAVVIPVGQTTIGNGASVIVGGGGSLIIQ